jgi:hypothetical protein
MSSHCDIKELEKHPYFTERLNNWKTQKCTIGVNTTNANGCLTDDELACYANNDLQNTRAQLDSTLTNIYQPQNSAMSSFDSNYQTTMLTAVVWAALGTTVLYYAFTKI